MFTVENSSTSVIIGRAGENAFRCIEIDVSDWQKKYPNSHISAVFERPDGVMYPVEIERQGAVVCWRPTNKDTYVGKGKLELRLHHKEILGKSAVFYTTCLAAIPCPDDEPDVQNKENMVLMWTETGPAWKELEYQAGGGVSYELTAATDTALGGIMADSREEVDTQPVRIGSDNKLYTAPAESSSVSDYTELENKPSINGVQLSGDKTSAELGIGEPTDEQVATSVETWLDAHPEATTTVADGSITADKLANDSVTPAKIADAIEYNQIFSTAVYRETSIYQCYIGGKGQETSANTSYRASDFISAKPSQLYTLSNCKLYWQQMDCYDADKAWLGRVTVDNNQFTTLANTAYIRFTGNGTIDGNMPDNAMICEGGTAYSEYFYGSRFALPNLDFSETGIDNTLSGAKLKNNTVDGIKLLDGSVSGTKIGVVDPDSIEGIDFVNLFDISAYEADIVNGLETREDTDKVLRGWLQSNGTLYTGSTQYTTICIPCKPNTEYSLYYMSDGVATIWPFQSRIAFRDVNQQIFGVTELSSVTFTAPDGAYEIVCTAPAVDAALTYCQKLMLVYGADTPEYAPHKATPTWLQASKQLDGVSVICYGDSLTQGMYPSKVADILGVPVADAGIGGNTVAQIHDRVGNYGTAFDVVTLMVGTNDNGGQTSCPLGTADDEAATDDNATAAETTYAARLKRLLNKIKATHRGATFVIMPPFQHSWGASTFEPVSELMGEIAKQYKMPYLDIYHLCGWDGTDAEDVAIFMADQTHENDVGAQRIAELLAGFIKQLKGA